MTTTATPDTMPDRGPGPSSLMRYLLKMNRTLLIAMSLFVLLAFVRAVTDATPLTSSQTVGTALRFTVPIMLAGLAGLWGRLGARSGVEVVLRESRSLFVLNAVRSPERWRKLKTSSSMRQRGRPRKLMECLDPTLELRLEVDSSITIAQQSWCTQCFGFGIDSETSQLQVLRLLGGDIAGVIVESDEIKIVPLKQERRFWVRWYKSHK